MRLAVLGPLEIDGRPPALRPRQRAVLERLLVTPGRAVSADQLLDELWPDPGSAGAMPSLHAQVSRLRRALGASAVETVGGEYRVVVDGGFDVWEFEEAMGLGRSALLDGRPEDAAVHLEDALARWRGEPFESVRDVDAARTEIARLEELRRIATLDRARADLERDAPSDALARLDAVDAPYDEERAALAILALYRSGRPTDALRRYEVIRRRLLDDLGLDPGPALRTLQKQVLDHDPALARVPSARRVAAPVAEATTPTDLELPPVEYATNGTVHLAYRVIEGDNHGLDLVWLPDFLFHLDVAWESDAYAAFLQGLAAGGRLITYDKRGQGLSDRLESQPTIEERVGDLLAVLDAVGAVRPLLFGVSEGAYVAAQTAHRHPDRVAGVVFFGSAPAGDVDEEWWTLSADAYLAWADYLLERWGTGRSLRMLAPSVADDARARSWYGRMERQSMSPTAIRTYARANIVADYRPILGDIGVPCLVVHRRNEAVPLAAAQFMADRLPNARLVELDGTDHLPWFGDAGAVLREVEAFRREIAAAPPAHAATAATR